MSDEGQDVERRSMSDAIARSTTVSTPTLAYLHTPGHGGEPVMFLHGVGSSSATWLELFARLGGGRRLIATDLRGHGDSAAPAGPYRLADFVDDHVRLLDELGLPSTHVVGFSLGALIAQAVALAHPARTSSLVLLGSVGARTEDERTRAVERLEVIRSSRPADVAAASVQRWFTAPFAERAPRLVADEVAIVSAVDPAAYAAAYEVLATNDLIEDVSGISCPTLVVTGEGDIGSTPRMSREIQARTPGAQLVIVPGVKHYLHIEGADVVADLITDFMGALPRQPGSDGRLPTVGTQ